MLSIGWTEMMIVAAFALIVVGPRDLPNLLRQIGKAVGSVRKMGNEFKAELNKVTAVDEIRNIKKSISAPLTETRKKIEQEFNSISKAGKIEPSGAIKPADPKAESVVDEIRAAAGLENTTKVTKPKTTRTKPKPKAKASSATASKANANKTSTRKTATSKATTAKTTASKATARKPRKSTTAKTAAIKTTTTKAPAVKAKAPTPKRVSRKSTTSDAG